MQGRFKRRTADVRGWRLIKEVLVITARVLRNDRTAGLAYLQLKGGGLGFQMVHLWPPNSLMRRRTGSSKLTARNHGVNFLAVAVVRNSEKYGLISLPMGISVRK